MDRRTFIRSAAALGVATGATLALPALAQGSVRSGTFTGLNGHVTTGTAQVDGSTVTLMDDFVFDGAPDPKVALGINGAYDPATLMGALRSDLGASAYTAPAGIDTSAYNEVWIWCERFNVALAVAPIS